MRCYFLRKVVAPYGCYIVPAAVAIYGRLQREHRKARGKQAFLVPGLVSFTRKASLHPHPQLAASSAFSLATLNCAMCAMQVR